MCINVDGTWRVCCKFMHVSRPPIANTTFEEFKNSEVYREVVDTMKTKWHPGCAPCKKVEDSNRKPSLREYANEKYSSSPGLESIEFSLSNDCNLKCRMCGPKYSNKWVDLIHENPHLIRTQDHDKYTLFEHNPEVDVEDLLSGVDLSRLKIIKYLGGEPFISTKISRLFEILDERGVIDKIEFHTNTNCTFFPEKLLPYLNKFKNMVITLSIDGYGRLNDYIRDGKDWKIVEETAMKWARLSWTTNMYLLVTPSVQAYNIHDIHNIHAFAKSNNIKFKTQNVSRPRHFSLDALPTEYLRSVENLSNTEDIQEAVFNHRLWEDFKKFTLDLDTALGKSIRDYIPRLYEYF